MGIHFRLLNKSDTTLKRGAGGLILSRKYQMNGAHIKQLRRSYTLPNMDD